MHRKRDEPWLRRTPNPGLTVDGAFQRGAGLTADGIVGPVTWAALPNGAPMPTLQEGSTGAVVNSLQTLLANGEPGSGTRHCKGRRQFRVAYESLRSGLSDLGRRRARWDCRRPDLDCFLACGERHTGNSGGRTVRSRLTPTQRTRLDALAWQTHAFGVGFDFIGRRSKRRSGGVQVASTIPRMVSRSFALP